MIVPKEKNRKGNNNMNIDEKEKINFISSLFTGYLWELDENELDELYKQVEVFRYERMKKTREFAHFMIDKFLVGVTDE